jgi:hypothetical protein
MTREEIDAMLRAMKRIEQRYLVNEVEVILVRDHSGARWVCGQCRGECEHILQAAARMTLDSWTDDGRVKLH